ncbi:MAG: hypothetical protein LUQ39_04820 [Methanomassiliicoccales archaeon]|jgi:hypothetical protein|nr:hypothetical protein [Methanomassiliicoccales archaeon]
MLEADLEPHLTAVENVPQAKSPAKPRKPRTKAKAKSKPEGFTGLAALINVWRPSDPSLTRNLLVNELRIKLEGEGCACINSCVPALIVDANYPVDVMHFRSRDDIDEFVTRMVWMQEVFNSAIGALIGVPDEETSHLIKDVCNSLLKMDEDCVVLLL